MLPSPHAAADDFLNPIAGARCRRAGLLRRLPRIACSAVLLFSTAAFALAPDGVAAHFIHTSWTESDGAPTNIRSIAQTPDGYLWLGTPTGLYSFDGIRFARFEPGAGETLPAVGIRFLLATRDGSLWVVFSSGVSSRLLDGHVTSYSESQGLPYTYALAESAEGTLIAGTAKGLSRFSNGKWEDVTQAWNFPGRRARALSFDRAGTLWVSTEDKVVYRPAGQNRFLDPGDATGYLCNFAEAPDGEIWASEPGRSAHTVRRLGDPPSMTEVRVGATWVLSDRSGGLWMASAGDGLRYLPDPSSIRDRQIPEFGPEAEAFTAKDGLSGDYVYNLLQDREGNLWASTSHGLDRFRRSVFVPVSIPHPDLPRAILATHDGGLWTFSVNPAEILRIGPNGDQQVALQHTDGASMTEDDSGTLWLARSYGVSPYRRGRFADLINSPHPWPGGVVLREIIGVTADRKGGLWLLDLDQGLFRLADGVLTRVPQQSEPVRLWGYLYTDRQGRVWVAQEDHVWLYDNGNARSFGRNDGLPPRVLFTICEDRAGTVWVGGSGGLSKFENGSFHPIPAENGLGSVYGMAQDDDGNWWIATDTGVVRVPAGQLDRAVDEPGFRIHDALFNMLDGLPGKPRQDFPMPIVDRTTDGRIWFVTNNGLAYVDPRHIARNNLPPPVHIEAVKIGDKLVAAGNGVVLVHSANDVEFDYTALSLSVPQRVLFRYRLEGADTEWHDAGTRRQAFYNRLGPGHYRFHVIACNNDGVWNDVGASWGFSIAPAWYQTVWFRFLAVFAGGALIWFLYRLRLRQMTAKVDLRYAERLDERTRIARELHDTLLQSFHGLMFQFQAARNLLPQKPDSAIQTLDHAIQATEQALAEGRDAIHGLRFDPEHQRDLAERLTAVEEEFAGVQTANRPVFRVIVEGKPRGLSPLLQDEIFRIGREGIRNAFSHAEARHIEVEIHYTDDQLRLRIRDDGKGMDARNLASSGRAGHWGLPGIRERAQQMDAQLEFWSEAGAGTEIELRVPGAIAYEKPLHERRFRLLRRRTRRREAP